MAFSKEELIERCDRARVAARRLAPLERAVKDAALLATARLVEERMDAVLAANADDVADAEAAELSSAMVDRLRLDPPRLKGVADSVRSIAALSDPVGEIVGMQRLDNGLLAGQQRIPLGVIAMIFESRPNVTVEAAALTLKSGNAVILRGGKEATRSNLALGEIVRAGLKEAGLPEDAVQVVPPLSRDETKVLLGLSGKIDLLIPRGGVGLIQFVTEHARVPVVQHFEGVCHVFVDDGADLDRAEAIVHNAKLQRPGVCNALECLLVHRDLAEAFVPRLKSLLDAGCEIRGDERTVSLLQGAKAATDDDWGKEFLDRVLAVRVVDDLDAALDHIARFGSHHTEAIVSESYARTERFLREVDASCVVANASTRFNDGGQLGLGAEVGISTTKLHAYGPMGLSGLTALKWIVRGDGQVRP